MFTRIATLTILVATVTSSPLTTSHIVERLSATQQRVIAPLHVSSQPENHILNSYIVVLKDGVDLASHTLVVKDVHAEDPLDGDVSGLTHIYNGQIKGYAGRFANSTIDKLRTMAEVEYIEHDQTVWASEVENGAPWVRSTCGFGSPT